MLKLKVDAHIMGFQKTHFQSDHTTDASKTPNTRLRWDHANLSSYYNYSFLKLGPILDVINSHYKEYSITHLCICRFGEKICSNCCIKHDLIKT